MGEESLSAPEKRTPKGVGGWLLIFCVGQILIAPLVSLNHLAVMWNFMRLHTVFPVVRQHGTIVTVVSLLVTLYGMIVGISIWKGSPHGRILARQYLVIRILIALFMTALIAWWALGFGGQFARRVFPRLLPSTALEVAGCLLWWCYFTYSKRVRNTYCNTGAQEIESSASPTDSWPDY
ncbi:MAG: hypothetical protein QOH39_2395 [Verrucomicrobiota bacterium]|jgi:hypothetical protein